MSARGRFLFWIQYDGSRFPEMARGGTGFGVMDLLHQTVADSFFGMKRPLPSEHEQLRFSPSSRTDSGVHALRNAITAQFPEGYACRMDFAERLKLITYWNDQMNIALPGGMSILDFHPVSDGFCARRSVSYRRYSYRLAVCRDWELWKSLRYDPSTACFSEKAYAWILPPGFSVHRAQSAANLFLGEQIMGSFYKHTLREKRRETRTQSTVRNIMLSSLTLGAPYRISNDYYDYYNVNVVSKSFVREQIRRMMSCIVFHAYDRLPLYTVKWLLKNPISSNFFDLRIPIAPPNGLFLVDVAYAPEQFNRPFPYYCHGWDKEIDAADDKIEVL